MKKHVDLHQSKDPVGWSASIATDRKAGDKKISMGESIIYKNKEAAWKSIQKQVQKLDYENDEILFNHQRVNSYSELESMVGAL